MFDTLTKELNEHNRKKRREKKEAKQKENQPQNEKSAKKKIIKEIKDKILASQFGVEGKAINPQSNEEVKERIDPGKLYKRRQPRDIKVRKIHQTKHDIKTVSPPSQAADLGELLISGLKVGAADEEILANHSKKHSVLRINNRARRSAKPSEKMETFELTGHGFSNMQNTNEML